MECPKPSPLKVSTMTILTKLVEISPEGAESEFGIDLDAFSRFIPVYDKAHAVIQQKQGGFVGINHSSIMPRGVVKKGKEKIEMNYKKSPFYNQATLVYEYWGCRYINIMMFRNGKFKMAGTVSELEATTITQVMVDIFKGINIHIYKDVHELEVLKVAEFYKYAITATEAGSYEYMIYNYFAFFENQTLFKKLEGIEGWFIRKGWISGSVIMEFIAYLKTAEIGLNAQFQEIKVRFNNLIAHEVVQDDIALRDSLNVEKTQLLAFINTLNLAIKWIEELRAIDISVMAGYVHPTQRDFKFLESARTIKFKSLKTELINSDFQGNFVVNNTKLQVILNTRYHVFPSYEPNDYPGLKIKYYWHESQTPEQRVVGKCPHEVSCITRGKRSVCIQITIAVFQSGSTIITAGKSIQQIEEAYKFITSVFRDNYSSMCRGGGKKVIESLNKLYENPSNEIRKMMKKKKLYYIKKTDIIQGANPPHQG